MPPAPSSTRAGRAPIEALKLERLRGLLREVLPRNAFYAAKLSRVADPAGLESR